jgi:hypothetical protein
MKKPSQIVYLLSLFAFGLLSLSSCMKDRSMEVIITVRLMSDTMVVLPGVRVELTQEEVEIVGYTDGNGQFRHTFEQPVQLDVHAFNDTLSGIGILNLGTYGRDVAKSIFVF